MPPSAWTRSQTATPPTLPAAQDRRLPAFSFLLLLYVFAGCAQAQAGCEQIAAGQKFWVRLLQPVASYSSKTGTGVRGILAVSPQCDGAPVFPAETNASERSSTCILSPTTIELFGFFRSPAVGFSDISITSGASTI